MNLLEHVPAEIIEVPWVGDGPSLGIGNAASDAYYGQRDAVPGPPSIVHQRAVGYSWLSPHVQEMAGPVFYPGWTADPITTGMAQQAPQVSLNYVYQDSITPIPFSLADANSPDVALGAPPISTGIPFIGRA